MTAHPKTDEANRKFIGWTWRAEVDTKKGPLDTNPVLSIYEWDEEMNSRQPISHKLKGTSVTPHDFSFSSNYYVFIENRVFGDTLPYILGNIGV